METLINKKNGITLMLRLDEVEWFEKNVCKSIRDYCKGKECDVQPNTIIIEVPYEEVTKLIAIFWGTKEGERLDEQYTRLHDAVNAPAFANGKSIYGGYILRI